MEDSTLRRILLDNFNNDIAYQMGNAVVALARKRNQSIAIEICRLNHTIFLYIDDGLPADKHNWLRRKANVAMHFEESSLCTKNDLINGKMSLEDPFGLDNIEYMAKGGSIPIFVNNAGMIGTITVSGLKDTEDHQIIIDALQGKFI